MLIFRRLLLLACLIPSLLAAQGRQALVVVAHGADSAWNNRVRAVVEAVQWQGPVELAFLMGPEAVTASWDSAIDRVNRAAVDSVVVVPLMVSSHGAHTRQIEYYAGLLAELPPELAGHVHGGGPSRPHVPIRVTGALDAAPELGVILLDRWREQSAADRARPVVLVAHGPTTDADARQWERALLSATQPLQQELGALPLRVGLIRDDAPPAIRAAAVASIHDTIAALAATHSDSVLVMTVLVSTSGINRVRVPADLSGAPMRYAGVVLAPHPALSRWIERVAGK